jgi:hypothetical protein
VIYLTARKDGHLIKQLMKKKETVNSSEADELLDFDLSSLLEAIGSYFYAGATLEQIDSDVYERLVFLLQEYLDRKETTIPKDATIH